MITELTRMWLTRSTKPFLFKKEYDQELPFSDCDGLGLYVHIPFCRSICSFCPYCKTLYSEEACSRYIDALIREIHLAGSQIPGKKIVTSLYFGGGTPALAADRIKEIIDAIRRTPGARSLDGVKRRTRAGMGRCQAGFCSPRVMEILARELGVPQSEITKSGGASKIIVGTNKDSL